VREHLGAIPLEAVYGGPRVLTAAGMACCFHSADHVARDGRRSKASSTKSSAGREGLTGDIEQLTVANDQLPDG